MKKILVASIVDQESGRLVELLLKKGHDAHGAARCNPVHVMRYIDRQPKGDSSLSRMLGGKYSCADAFISMVA